MPVSGTVNRDRGHKARGRWPFAVPPSRVQVPLSAVEILSMNMEVARSHRVLHRLIAVVCTCLFAAGPVKAEYSATLEDADWAAQSATHHCELVHDIPDFGRARFVQSSGKPLTLTLEVQRQKRPASHARMTSRPPPWRHGGSSGTSHNIAIGPEYTLNLTQGQAEWAINELERGMSPFISYRARAVSQPVAFSLQPVRFLDALPEFQRCVAGLIKFDFTIVKEREVRFEENSVYLHRPAREIIDYIVKQYRTRPKERAIVIGAHADKQEDLEANPELAQRRADEIKAYLERRGIPADRVTTRSFHTRWQAGNDDSEEQRAANRRAVVWLTKR